MIVAIVIFICLLTGVLTRPIPPTPPKEGEFDAMAQFQINMDNNKKHEDEKSICKN